MKEYKTILRLLDSSQRINVRSELLQMWLWINALYSLILSARSQMAQWSSSDFMISDYVPLRNRWADCLGRSASQERFYDLLLWSKSTCGPRTTSQSTGAVGPSCRPFCGSPAVSVRPVSWALQPWRSDWTHSEAHVSSATMDLSGYNPQQPQTLAQHPGHFPEDLLTFQGSSTCEYSTDERCLFEPVSLKIYNEFVQRYEAITALSAIKVCLIYYYYHEVMTNQIHSYSSWRNRLIRSTYGCFLFHSFKKRTPVEVTTTDLWQLCKRHITASKSKWAIRYHLHCALTSQQLSNKPH